MGGKESHFSGREQEPEWQTFLSTINIIGLCWHKDEDEDAKRGVDGKSVRTKLGCLVLKFLWRIIIIR